MTDGDSKTDNTKVRAEEKHADVLDFYVDPFGNILTK